MGGMRYFSLKFALNIKFKIHVSAKSCRSFLALRKTTIWSVANSVHGLLGISALLPLLFFFNRKYREINSIVDISIVLSSRE